MNDNGEPDSKRRRYDEDKLAEAAAAAKEEEDDDLSRFLEGDDFVTDDDRAAAEAKQRREQRRKRLQKLQEPPTGEEGTTPKPIIISSSSSTPMPPTTRIKVEETDTRGRIATVKNRIDHQVGDVVRTRVDEVVDEGATAKKDAGDDEFDMFSSSLSPPSNSTAKSSSKRGHKQEDWDDVEGYYKAVLGESIEFRGNPLRSGADLPESDSGSVSFRVLGVIGKGVFSTVLKCSTVSNSTSSELPPIVALKCIRHNETMAKAAMNELRTLHKLKGAAGIVPLLLPITDTHPLEHRGHVVFAFSFMEYNLREVLQKFGKGVGISLQAVRSYFGQMLAAATHLQKHGIIHADLKPDNILVSADFGFVQLADFGSAIDIKMPEQNQPTPYLVSRFYRAPEIILGLVSTFAIDLWSLSVTVAELFLGNVLFRGRTNNDMLYVFMQHLGPFSNRVIRQHMVICERLPIACHFQQQGTNYYFNQQAIDKVTGAPIHTVMSLIPHNNDNKFPSATPLHQKFVKAKSVKDSRNMILQFSDLLQKCLALDPSKRIAVKDALRHEFFQ